MNALLTNVSSFPDPVPMIPPADSIWLAISPASRVFVPG
jgi:hypothetical protein